MIKKIRTQEKLELVLPEFKTRFSKEIKKHISK